MRSTFMSLETAKRSLNTQQAAINTVGHNIANANTEGYTRQTVTMTASRPIEAFGMNRSLVPGQMGTGVEFTAINRIRTAFLDDQFRSQNQYVGSWSIQSDTLDKLQAMMNEPSDSGIRTVLDNFWKSWSDLSKNPEDVTGRKILRESAIALTDTFNQISKQLSDLNGDLTTNVGVKANEINSTVETIAKLNDQIVKVESLGDNANDLRDQRDLLTDNLSKIVNITVTDTSAGYTINMGSVNLVNGSASTETSAEALQNAFAAGDLSGGEAYGMIFSRDKYVADYQAQLDTLANTLANGDVTVTIPAGSVIPDNTTLVTPSGAPLTFSGTSAQRTLASDTTVIVKGLNGLHKLGYLFTDPATTGGDIFTAKSGTAITASNIQLNPAIQNDVTLIATSMRTETVTDSSGTREVTIKGNNTLALLMGQLKDSDFTFAGGATNNGVSSGTMDDYFQSIVGQMGSQAQEATRQMDNQQNLIDQIDSKRQSVSGVSLDEEMSNLIAFQHAYGAAARFMTTFDQILDKLINGTGVVGR